MQIKRAVISLLLLLTYSLGFADYLVPHCEASKIEQQAAEHQGNSHHHHEHHEHPSEDEKNIDHEHVVHNDHLDGGLYDLILCFLSEMEHPSKDCNLKHYSPANTNDKVNTQLAKAKFVAVLFAAFCIVAQDEALPKFRSEFAAIYLSPPVGDSLIGDLLPFLVKRLYLIV